MTPGLQASAVPKRKLFITDDHPIVRKGLRDTINAEPDLAVCGEATDPAETLRAIEKLQPDLLVLDLNLKGNLCLDLIRELKAQCPGTLVLILSMFEERLLAERTLQAGARGYLNKQDAVNKVVVAIRVVLSGKIYLSAAMNFSLAQKCANGGKDALSSPVDQLSDRELEIFHLLGQGRAPRQIAALLRLDVHTVETYRMRIKEKLHLTSAMEVLQRAIPWSQSGYLPKNVTKPRWYSSRRQPRS